MKDARKTHLRKGLAQLNKNQIQKILDTPEELLIMDEYFYYKGRY